MRKQFYLLLMLCMALPAMAVSGLKGTLVDAVNGKPVADANVLLRDQALFVTSDQNGVFEIRNAGPGTDILRIVAYGYQQKDVDVDILSGVTSDLGVIRLDPSAFDVEMNSDEFIFDEAQIDSDEGMAQNVGTIQGATDDIYYQASNYNFSILYYKPRGLDNTWNTGYINGVAFNDPMRGSFSYSGLGGLTSSAFRNKSVTLNMDASAYGYGSLAGSSNITTYASEYAPGFRGNLSYTNSAYMLRAMLQYSSGVNRHGWAFSASIIGRYAPEGVVEGTFYNSLGYALSLQKIFNEHHSINISTWGAPTQRATQGTSFQEAYDLAGSNLYNPSWGYFFGKKRSARVVESFDPSAIINWIWKPNLTTTVNTALGYRHNAYAQTRLQTYGYSTNPDYYRNMPSFYAPTAEPGTELYDAQLAQYNDIVNLWRTDESVRQINWDNIYMSNVMNREQFDRNPEYAGQSSTVLENNHSNFGSWMLNSYIDTRLKDWLSLQGGLSFNYTNAHYFKTMDDLLGGLYWRDIDTYSERDFGANNDVLQNDLNNPDRKITEKGQVFGYDYNIKWYFGQAWLQNQINTAHWNVNYGAKVSYTNFMRYGNMRNGRAPENSYGNGKTHEFVNYSVKAGATYKLDGRNYFSGHIEYGTRAPRPYDSYVSSRIKDDIIPGLKSEKYLGADLSYTWNYAAFRGSFSGFWNHVWDGSRHTGFYDYDLKSFMNYSISGMETEYKGLELGVEWKIWQGLSMSFAGTWSKYQYKNNPTGVRSYENGRAEDVVRKVYLKNYYVGCTPQQAYSVALKYNINMWFFEINANYLNENYYDLNYSRHEELPGLWKFCTTEQEYEDRLAVITKQDKLKDCFVMNLSIGKMIYTKFGSLNFNVGVTNLLNNRNIQIRGWQDGKFDYTDYNVNKYPNKVQYAQGIKVFVNAGIRF